MDKYVDVSKKHKEKSLNVREVYNKSQSGSLNRKHQTKWENENRTSDLSFLASRI